MSDPNHIHTIITPTASAAVSCVLGFKLHTLLGVAGEVIGVLSGCLSIAWVSYQMYRTWKSDNDIKPKG